MGFLFICLFYINSLFYFIYNIVNIAYDLLISKPQYMKAKVFKIVSSYTIKFHLLFRKMIFTINFYNKITCQACEIHNVVTNNMLSAESVRTRPRL